jgi:hypothetical protein
MSPSQYRGEVQWIMLVSKPLSSLKLHSIFGLYGRLGHRDEGSRGNRFTDFIS